MLVGDIIRHNALTRPHDEALVVGEGRYTYDQLEDRVRGVSAALRGAGIGRGDRVAVLAKNTLEYFLLYFATASTGSILVPLNFWHRAAEHEYTIGNCDPTLLFVEDELRASLGALPEHTRVLSMPVADTDRGDWEAFLAGGAGHDGAAAPGLDEQDTHMILYTSGTTGRPKGAMLSHRRTVDDAVAMAAALQPTSGDVFMNYFPPFHVGNWDHMKLFLLMGGRVCLLRQFDAGEVLATLEREGVTVVLGVPTMLHELLNHPSLATTDLSSVRLVYYGAYDPSGIMQRTAEVFGAHEGRCAMAHTFGLTEGGPFVTLCLPSEIFQHWGSIGRAIPGVEIALLDSDNKPVAPGQAGELCFKGPRMSGYWANPEATAAAIVDGWLHTGDIAHADDEGFLFIVDRKKDMIRSGGQNVYSKEVEDCLQGHPAVSEAGVIGLPDPRYEEQVCAVVVLRAGHDPSEATADTIKAWVREHLAGYNTPRTVRFVDELPRNAVGKIQKHLLRDEYGSVFSQAAHSADDQA
ncbi:AMP-binding protein [Acidiferrimicrobium sp. IK]|uniref:class I adenylate-forming enzyme family protein n=1 Tax=Acidiferrimicrobium sp. IK TaxID=2871700 RepID=UPI0021CB571E|nr:AMP-binding protein [Acidiferrimicrobium sp. IK]MCU4183270.1 AMP-binding protein [Acidiferrimicrobium sp. IK]